MSFKSFFNRFPYTDFHELNLDWLLQTVAELKKKIEEFPEVENNYNFDDPDEPAPRQARFFNSARNYFSGIWRTVLKDNVIFGSPLVNAGSANIATVNDVSSMARSRYNACTCFRFAYRMPEGNSFTVDEFLAQAQHEKDVYSRYEWVYITDSSTAVPGQFSTIPLFDPDDPSVVLNVNGKCTSCATSICNILYRLGYIDLAGDAKYTEARVLDYNMIYALQRHGWTRIDEENDVQAGDIVFTSASVYGDERRFNPGHEFIMGRNSLVYDYGSTAMIQSGGATPYDTTSYGVRFVSASWDGENMLVNGPASNPAGTGTVNADWIGSSYPGYNSNGVATRYAKMYNPDRCVHWIEVDSVNSSGNVIRESRTFPLTATHLWHDITTVGKVFENGTVILEFDGTPDTQLGADVNYLAFTFNFYNVSGFKYITDDLDNYVVCTASGALARIYATTESDITRVYFSPVTAINEPIHCRIITSLV